MSAFGWINHWTTETIWTLTNLSGTVSVVYLRIVCFSGHLSWRMRCLSTDLAVSPLAFVSKVDGEWTIVYPATELSTGGERRQGPLQAVWPAQTGKEAAQDVQTRPGRGRDPERGHHHERPRMPVSVPLREVELHLGGAPPSQHAEERYGKMRTPLAEFSDQTHFHFSVIFVIFVISPAGFKETAFLYAISSAGLTHAMAKACSAGRMERCTCDEAPDLENRKAWQWGGCGDNLKYANKFVKDFLGKRSNKDLRARVDMHNTNVGMKVNLMTWVIKGELHRFYCRSHVCLQWHSKCY